MRKMQKKWKQWMASFLVVTMFATSVSLEAFATENTGGEAAKAETASGITTSENQTGNYKPDKADIIQSELTADSTTYDAGNGKKITEFYSQDVRFKDEEGKLTDYDPTLIKIQNAKSVQGHSLKDYAYENRAGDKKQYFPEELTEDTPILMEYGKYRIRLAPSENLLTEGTKAEVETETFTDIYEKEKSLPVKAVYSAADENVSYQYTSTDIGVKEEIVLDEMPDTNVFTSTIEIPGLIIRKNALDEGFTIYDGDDIVAGIQAPNMNDATGEAYSEDASYELRTVDEKEGKYELILTVDEEYLKAEERKYPVTIDPTITWSGDTNVCDVYVLSGSTYKDINFYDSGITAFHAGKVSQGISRTYISFASISALYGRYVESAKLVLTEATSSDASQTVNAYRVTESWSKSKITWNNKPAYNTTVLSSIKTKGTNKTKYTLNLTTLFRGYAKKSYSNYGILLKNPTETGKHGRFYGARVSTTSYRPKLTIVHYDPPTKAESVVPSPRYIKKGSTTTVTWSGITAKSLSYFNYRLANYDYDTKTVLDTVIPYSTSTKIGGATATSGTVSACSKWNEGIYMLYVRGVDTSGVAGPGKGCLIYIDGTPPTISEPVITPYSSETDPSENITPTIQWSNASDKYFKQVEYKLNDSSFQKMGTTASGTYTLPEGIIDANGKHTITVRAVDKAGNTKSYELNYFVDSSQISFQGYLPEEDAVQIRNEYGKNTITWEIEKELSDSVFYRIYRGDTSDFTADETSLIADHVKGTYWTDIQSAADKIYYYKIEAVRLDISGNVEDSLFLNTVVSAQGISITEFQKRTGQKDYRGYYSFVTPIGNGTIEKSRGNLNYSQEDAVITENQLTLDITRHYNSQLNVTGMLGQGWTDSLHKELIVDENGTVYLLESDGSVYKFEKNGDSYVCSETKGYELKSGDTGGATTEEEQVQVQKIGVEVISTHVGQVFYCAPPAVNVPDDSDPADNTRQLTLEEEIEETDEVEESVVEESHDYTIKTSEGLLYRFNEGGQLVSVLEPNGAFLLYQYGEDGKLASVQTENEKKLELSYNEDGKLSEIQLMDGTSLFYEYTDGVFTESGHSSADKENSVSNHYAYNDGRLESVTDRKGEEYHIEYSDGKAQKVICPNQESYVLDYQTSKTIVTKKNESGTSIYTTTTEYDVSTGKVLKETDADGQSVTYAYEFEANPYLVTKTTGTIGYQELVNGRVEFRTEQKAAETSYDSEEKVTQEISEDGTVTMYTYEGTSEWNEELPTEVEAVKDGEIISSSETEYDDKGNVTRETDETDADNLTVTENEYDDAGNLKDSVVIEDGLETSHSVIIYDEHGNPVSETETSGNIESEESNTYDGMGRILTSTDETTGEVTAYTYDYLGRIIKTESTAAGKTLTSTSSYDANGTVISETDTNGVTTTYEYDPMNRVISRTVSKGDTITYTTSYSYGDIKVHDGRNDRTISNAYIERENYPDGAAASEKYYDANGKLVKEKTGGLYVDYSYDESGNQVTAYHNGTAAEVTDGRVILTLYDREGRQTASIENPEVEDSSYIIGEDTIITTQTYDTKGNVETETDANGIVTAYVYDDSSRITQVTQDVNGEKVVTTASYTTDTENTVTTITDAKGHVSKEINNAAGLTESVRDYGDETESIGTSYKYDSRGNMTEEVYENGACKKYIYDERNLLIQTESYTEDDTLTLQTEYTYDDQYRLIKTIDSKAEDSVIVPFRYSYTGYDAFGRTAWTAEVNSESEPMDDVISNSKIIYTYDAEDKVTEIGYTLVETGGVEKLHFVYNDKRWLTAVQATVKGDETVKTVREYIYDNQGKVSEIREYLDFAKEGTVCITKTYAYNVLDQVTSMVYKKGSDILESYSYQYDKNGNIIEKTEVNNTPSADADKVNETKQYTYDALGRLVKTVVTNHLDADAQQTINYEYDKVGNRTKKIKGSTEVTYTYNGLDQLLTAVTNRGGVEVGTTTYTYDANGNQVKEVNTDTLTTTVNVYDAENRLSKVTRTTQASDGTKETFVQENLYNGEGQRIQKKEGDKVTNYFYQDSVVSYTTDADDDVKVLQNLLGLEGNIILAEKKLETVDETDDSHNYYLYNKDIQGSTVSILDETGAGELSYTYDDFGETEVHGNSSFENEVCYTGGIYDESTGLYYLNARYYDPATGRFLTEDTYRGESDKAEDWHLYVYCNNNPISDADPSGYLSKKQADKVIKSNKKYIKTAAKKYKVNNKIVASCIYTELRRNVNLLDKVDGIVAFYGVADTSIGLGQVKVSTAKLLEKKGYVTRTKRSRGGWKIGKKIYYGSENMARVKRLENNSENTIYVAAYIKYWIDIWKPKYSKISSDAAILGTLYNLGDRAKKPNKSPKPNSFGRDVKKYYSQMGRLLK